MKKLTNTQIKSIKSACDRKTAKIDINDEIVEITVKTHLTSIDCENIQRYVDTVVFIDDEYYPQYVDIAINVAWLAVCTNIPLVMKKENDTEGKIKESVDWDTNNIVAQYCIETFVDCITSSLYKVKNIADRYIEHKLKEYYSTLSKQTTELIRRSNEAIDFIDRVSKEMVSVYSNPDLLQEIKELSNTTQDLNKRFEMSASDNFIKIISKES